MMTTLIVDVNRVCPNRANQSFFFLGLFVLLGDGGVLPDDDARVSASTDDGLLVVANCQGPHLGSRSVSELDITFCESIDDQDSK